MISTATRPRPSSPSTAPLTNCAPLKKFINHYLFPLKQKRPPESRRPFLSRPQAETRGLNVPVPKSTGLFFVGAARTWKNLDPRDKTDKCEGILVSAERRPCRFFGRIGIRWWTQEQKGKGRWPPIGPRRFVDSRGCCSPPPFLPANIERPSRPKS